MVRIGTVFKTFAAHNNFFVPWAPPVLRCVKWAPHDSLISCLLPLYQTSGHEVLVCDCLHLITIWAGLSLGHSQFEVPLLVVHKVAHVAVLSVSVSPCGDRFGLSLLRDKKDKKKMTTSVRSPYHHLWPFSKPCSDQSVFLSLPRLTQRPKEGKK